MGKERGNTETEEKADPANVVDEDDDDDELKKVDGVNSIIIGPDGAPMKRNNSDVMNNFFIMFACRCFTDIDKLIKNQGTQDPRKVAKFMLQIEAKKTQWESSTIGQFEKQGVKYTSYINSSLGLKT